LRLHLPLVPLLLQRRLVLSCVPCALALGLVLTAGWCGRLVRERLRCSLQ